MKPYLLTKSCHPNISGDITSDRIKNLVSIEVVVPHELNLKTKYPSLIAVTHTTSRCKTIVHNISITRTSVRVELSVRHFLLGGGSLESEVS